MNFLGHLEDPQGQGWMEKTPHSGDRGQGWGTGEYSPPCPVDIPTHIYIYANTVFLNVE